MSGMLHLYNEDSIFKEVLSIRQAYQNHSDNCLQHRFAQALPEICTFTSNLQGTDPLPHPDIQMVFKLSR